MMRRTMGTAIFATVVIASAAAIANAATANAPSMPTTKVEGAGISLQYPSTWKVVALTKQRLAAQIRAAAKHNPKLAAQLAKIDVSDFKFKAFGVPAEPGTTPSMSVDIGGYGQRVTLAQVKALTERYAKPVGATVVDAKAVKVSGDTAFRTDIVAPYTTSDGTIIRRLEGQLSLPYAPARPVVTVGAADNTAGKTLINKILASVRNI
jgi:hypothetical protein